MGTAYAVCLRIFAYYIRYRNHIPITQKIHRKHCRSRKFGINWSNLNPLRVKEDLPISKLKTVNSLGVSFRTSQRLYTIFNLEFQWHQVTLQQKRIHITLKTTKATFGADDFFGSFSLFFCGIWCYILLVEEVPNNHRKDVSSTL